MNHEKQNQVTQRVLSGRGKLINQKLSLQLKELRHLVRLPMANNARELMLFGFVINGPRLRHSETLALLLIVDNKPGKAESSNCLPGFMRYVAICR